MNEKQIDLDAMRALARHLHGMAEYSRNGGTAILTQPEEAQGLAHAFDVLTDEIEQLRKEQEFGVNANQDLMCELEMANAYIEELRKERDTLLVRMKQVEMMLRANPFIMVNAANLLSQAAQGDKP